MASKAGLDTLYTLLHRKSTIISQHQKKIGSLFADPILAEYKLVIDEAHHLVDSFRNADFLNQSFRHYVMTRSNAQQSSNGSVTVDREFKKFMESENASTSIGVLLQSILALHSLIGKEKHDILEKTSSAEIVNSYLPGGKRHAAHARQKEILAKIGSVLGDAARDFGEFVNKTAGPGLMTVVVAGDPKDSAVEETVASIKAQNYPRKEIMIVHTSPSFNKSEQVSPGVYVISQTDVSCSASGKNWGGAMARGSTVVFVEPHVKLEQGVLYSIQAAVKNGAVGGTVKAKLSRGHVKDKAFLAAFDIGRKLSFAPCGLLFAKQDVLRKLKFQIDNITHEHDFLHSLEQFGKRIYLEFPHVVVPHHVVDDQGHVGVLLDFWLNLAKDGRVISPLAAE